MTRPKYKVRVGTAPTKENANEIRRQGIREWWEACTEEKITNSFGSFFSSDEISLLPKRLCRCVRTTESLADFVKKGGKR